MTVSPLGAAGRTQTVSTPFRFPDALETGSSPGYMRAVVCVGEPPEGHVRGHSIRRVATPQVRASPSVPCPRDRDLCSRGRSTRDSVPYSAEDLAQRNCEIIHAYRTNYVVNVRNDFNDGGRCRDSSSQCPVTKPPQQSHPRAANSTR